MGTKAKTRIVVPIEGKDRELFSIRQTSKGDIVLIRRGEDNQGNDAFNLSNHSPLIENHISIHRSDKSALRGTTIKSSVLLEGNVLKTSAAFIKYSKNTLCWQLYSAICPDLRIERYDVAARSQDTIFRIGTDHSCICCMIIHVFATSLSRNIPDLFCCQKYEISFRLFKIVIYLNYVNIPQQHFGVIAFLPTSAPRINGASDPVDVKFFASTYDNGAQSLADSDILPIVHEMNQNLFDRAVMLTVLHYKDEKLQAALESVKPYFTVFPISTDKPLYVLEPPPGPWSPPKPK